MFKPSRVYLAEIPLTDAFGKSEVGAAAALIVRACQVRGDAWQSVDAPALSEILAADEAAGRPSFADLMRLPLFQPDVRGLVAAGYARWSEDERSVELTVAGLQRLERWVLPESDPRCAGGVT